MVDLRVKFSDMLKFLVSSFQKKKEKRILQIVFSWEPVEIYRR